MPLISPAPNDEVRKQLQGGRSVRSCGEKDFDCCFSEIVLISLHPASCRGTYASSRYVEVGCGGRDACARRAQAGADGEVVWSWPLDAEVCATR